MKRGRAAGTTEVLYNARCENKRWLKGRVDACALVLVALPLLLTSGCVGDPFTVDYFATKADGRAAISSDDSSPTDSIEKPDSSPPIDQADGSVGQPIEKPDGMQIEDGATFDVTPSDAMLGDVSSDGSHEDAACVASACPANACIPVYQVACCRADGACGCRNAQMGVWPCN